MTVIYVGALEELLGVGLAALLAAAAGDGLSEPWPRVHALNVLRLAFSESSLAVLASGYFARGA